MGGACRTHEKNPEMCIKNTLENVKGRALLKTYENNINIHIIK
jgi:hypothetical protein